MNRDKEIYAVASIYIRDHGDDAVIEAAMRADALLDAGDLDGRNVWLRVIEAIKVLSRPDRPSKAGFQQIVRLSAPMCDPCVPSH